MGGEEVAINLQTLMGHLESGVFARLLKAIKLWLEIFGGHGKSGKLIYAKGLVDL